MIPGESDLNYSKACAGSEFRPLERQIAFAQSGNKWLGRMALTMAALLAINVCGCEEAQKPGQSDVPPLPKASRFHSAFVDLNPRWSHNGKHIAFYRSTPDRRLQLFEVDPKLDRPHALLESEIVSPDRPYRANLDRYSSPDSLSWSQDDLDIAFERAEWFTFEDGERLPGTSIWRYSFPFGRVTPLALHPSHYTSVFYYYHDPQWSSDGRYLAFVAEGINGQRTVCTTPVARRRAQDVVPRFDNYADSDWPTWRPYKRGRQEPAQLVFRQRIQRSFSISATETLRRISPGLAASDSAGEIARLNRDEYLRLTSASLSSHPLNSDQAVALRTFDFSWSPNSGRIAFVLSPNVNDRSSYEIWVVDSDGGNLHRVSKPADRSTGRCGYIAPVWIDSDSLGALRFDCDPEVNAHNDAKSEAARFHVVTLDVDNGEEQELGTIGSADCDWSPDRSKIVWAERRGGLSLSTSYGVAGKVGNISKDHTNSDAPTTLRLFHTGLRISH